MIYFFGLPIVARRSQSVLLFCGGKQKTEKLHKIVMQFDFHTPFSSKVSFGNTYYDIYIGLLGLLFIA